MEEGVGKCRISVAFQHCVYEEARVADEDEVAVTDGFDGDDRVGGQGLIGVEFLVAVAVQVGESGRSCEGGCVCCWADCGAVVEGQGTALVGEGMGGEVRCDGERWAAVVVVFIADGMTGESAFGVEGSEECVRVGAVVFGDEEGSAGLNVGCYLLAGVGVVGPCWGEYNCEGVGSVVGIFGDVSDEDGGGVGVRTELSEFTRSLPCFRVRAKWRRRGRACGYRYQEEDNPEEE